VTRLLRKSDLENRYMLIGGRRFNCVTALRTATRLPMNSAGNRDRAHACVDMQTKYFFRDSIAAAVPKNRHISQPSRKSDFCNQSRTPYSEAAHNAAGRERRHPLIPGLITREREFAMREIGSSGCRVG
jgi:hypothetical protein